ncbi:M15 family metallopeptidase [Aliterella atlantica]|uniref:D-alanyl-D-alanine carboxypeptidase n=1 Tax=Aliterella atlantica CENA595 TaxID=1618023 RepID=A0A0D8ZVE1_9CYAN|nr:M15 family metallopeptidase [Aliterella atlantica]KJH72439.1 D-alanyl-D-alanine carboxypeptidase [Aliterella atlantica CENA595]
MDKGKPKKPQKVPARSIDDIPEALRDTHRVQPRRRFKLALIFGLLGLSILSLSAIVWSLTSLPAKNTNNPTSVATSSPTPTAPNSRNSDTLLGHFAYTEAVSKDLQPISRDRRLKLRKSAAQQFQAMVAAAKKSGVIIVPISGFRSVQEQQHLFFDVKAERGQTTTKRAEVSAPPGYSEHHTGYAVDIGDGRASATNLNTKFEKTQAYKWLVANAARYSFELSFPKNNSQGVSYEPWHWRYVGDRQSLETFYKSKNLKRNTP